MAAGITAELRNRESGRAFESRSVQGRKTRRAETSTRGQGREPQRLRASASRIAGRAHLDCYVDREFTEMFGPRARVPAGPRPPGSCSSTASARKLPKQGFAGGRTVSARSTTSRSSPRRRAGHQARGDRGSGRGADGVRVRRRGAARVHLPQWKGLTLKKPVRDFTDQDVHRTLQVLLAIAAGSCQQHARERAITLPPTDLPPRCWKATRRRGGRSDWW